MWVYNRYCKGANLLRFVFVLIGSCLHTTNPQCWRLGFQAFGNNMPVLVLLPELLRICRFGGEPGNLCRYAVSDPNGRKVLHTYFSTYMFWWYMYVWLEGGRYRHACADGHVRRPDMHLPSLRSSLILLPCLTRGAFIKDPEAWEYAIPPRPGRIVIGRI